MGFTPLQRLLKNKGSMNEENGFVNLYFEKNIKKVH